MRTDSWDVIGPVVRMAHATSIFSQAGKFLTGWPEGL